jgi:hypothetical protein
LKLGEKRDKEEADEHLKGEVGESSKGETKGHQNTGYIVASGSV